MGLWPVWEIWLVSEDRFPHKGQLPFMFHLEKIYAALQNNTKQNTCVLECSTSMVEILGFP